MKVRNLNSSSKKTKQLIKENFIDLLFEKGDIRKVKVTELVKRANIDRTTFYSHYDNIYALAQDFEDEFLDLIDSEINNINSYDDLFSFYDKLKNIVKTGENRYKMVANSNFNFHFYNNTNKKIKDLIYKIAVKLKSNKDKDELFFKSCVYVDGLFVQVIKCLSDKEYKYDLDSIIEYAKDIFKTL